LRLTEPERQTLAETMTRKTYRKGEVLVEEGGKLSSLMIIRTGVVVVSCHAEEGELELRRLAPGDYFGESALLPGACEMATIRALTFTVAGNYTLTASSGALTPATSSGFTLTSTITGAITSTFTSVTIEDASDTFVGKANGDPNVPSLGVTWKMISCGGSSTTLGPCGTLASNGTYTPPNKVPAAPGNVFVAQATAVADPSKTVLTGNIQLIVA